MFRLNSLFIIMLCLTTACSNTPPVDEQVVANSPTHPKVSQRPVVKKEQQVAPGDPKFSPIRRSDVAAIQVPSGSLFNPRLAIGLYQPANHYQVGDMILVKIKENTSADKSVNYKSGKKGHFELDPVTLNAGSIKVANGDLNAEYEQSKDFDSSAKTKQNNSLRGDITVYVTEVLNNGNLLVAGEKWITLNTGEEYIRFSGEIRVSEVGLDHTIASVKVGNAHIEYSGVGEMHDNQKASLLAKLFGIFE
jgi:flagellar L-ring protein precursor FlgH